MFPELYQTHLTTQLNKAQYLILSILIQLLQSYRWVRLEELANKFPQPILFESRRKKLQRYLDLPSLTIETIRSTLLVIYRNSKFDLYLSNI